MLMGNTRSTRFSWGTSFSCPLMHLRYFSTPKNHESLILQVTRGAIMVCDILSPSSPPLQPKRRVSNCAKTAAYDARASVIDPADTVASGAT